MTSESGLTTNRDSCRIDVGVVDGPVPIEAIAWPADCGAEGIFVGRTRGETHPEHGELQRLAYEMFEPMVLKLLGEIADRAALQWDCRAIRVVHAKGAVPLGAASVVVQVATPHRADSFAACRFLIDTLKAELPIWKREIWADGETFVEGAPVAQREEGGE